MIRFDIDDFMLMEAQNRSDRMGVLSSSRTKGKGNVVGFLGEAAVLSLTRGELCDTMQFDILLNGKRLDVKTKSCSSVPKGHYLCSVMNYQLGNGCDSYVFVRIDLPKREGWILGQISKSRLLSEGVKCKKGDPDGNFIFKEDCVSIRVDKLDEISRNQS